MDGDHGLETLLDLDGSIFDQEDGYWIRIQAWRVVPGPGLPHSVRYSLTLHEPGGRRVLGYDNAHAVAGLRGAGSSGEAVPFDHRHRHATDEGAPYVYRSAYELLGDFFAEVDRVLKELK